MHPRPKAQDVRSNGRHGDHQHISHKHSQRRGCLRSPDPETRARRGERQPPRLVWKNAGSLVGSAALFCRHAKRKKIRRRLRGRNLRCAQKLWKPSTDQALNRKERQIERCTQIAGSWFADPPDPQPATIHCGSFPVDDIASVCGVWRPYLRRHRYQAEG